MVQQPQDTSRENYAQSGNSDKLQRYVPFCISVSIKRLTSAMKVRRHNPEIE